MKIGIFHPSLDYYGGAEIVALASANSLAKSGYETVLCVNKQVDQGKTEEMIGEPLDRSVKVIVDPDFLKPRGNFHIYESAVRSLILKSNCDLLMDTYSCLCFPWLDVCYFHFPWNRDPDLSHKSFFSTMRPHIIDVVGVPYNLTARSIERFGDKLILANSLFTAKAVMRYMGLNSKVLYPPVPNSFFQEGFGNFETPRQDLVVTVARFGPGKNVELIPDVAYLTNKKIRFLMIGLAHDPQVILSVKEKIKRLHLEDRVQILTNASREEIKSYLKSAKVYLHTMQFEHFGISIAEAMAMGCAPVVHNSGGAPEFVPDKYRYNSPQEAAETVEKSMQDWTPKEAARLAHISERFSQDNFSKRFIELFSEYCSSRQKN